MWGEIFKKCERKAKKEKKKRGKRRELKSERGEHWTNALDFHIDFLYISGHINSHLSVPFPPISLLFPCLSYISLHFHNGEMAI